MILDIDQKILTSFKEKDIKIYFYDAGCEWTKVNFSSEFEKAGLENISLLGKNIFFEWKDSDKLDGAKILPKVSDNSQHSQNDKYLFLSPKIQSRCSCATSFSFEKKLIEKSKLEKLKWAFKK